MESREERWRDFGALVVRLTRGEDITRQDARECWRQICEEEQSDLQQGAFIGALKAKPETPEEVAGALGEGALGALAAIPRPGDPRLVERLVTLGPGSALAVLAERLDHLRHLHLREDLIDGWADAWEEVAEAWLPFAGRIHERLATRYAHWARTFVKRI